MRTYLFFIFCLLYLNCHSQIQPSEITGSWVASKVAYLSGDELPDENILKYSFTKYTFEGSDKLYISNIYSSLGAEFRKEINGSRLLVKSVEGYLMNTLRIMELTRNQLVVVSADANGSFESPTAIRYAFLRE